MCAISMDIKMLIVASKFEDFHHHHRFPGASHVPKGQSGCQHPSVCQPKMIVNLPILGRHYKKIKNDRDLCFCILAKYVVKAKLLSLLISRSLLSNKRETKVESHE